MLRSGLCAAKGSGLGADGFLEFGVFNPPIDVPIDEPDGRGISGTAALAAAAAVAVGLSTGDTPQSDKPPAPKLYRFGLEPETTSVLATQAAAAYVDMGIHGVSVYNFQPTKNDSRWAYRTAVEATFGVRKTRGPGHYTVILPDPVTNDVTAKWNALFSHPVKKGGSV